MRNQNKALNGGPAGIVGELLKLGSLQETISALAACVGKLTKKLSAGQVSRKQKYGTPKSREFKLPPQRFTTPDRTARLVNSSNRMVLTDLTRLLTRHLCETS